MSKGLICPKCGSDMLPLNGGKGWRCGKAGNRFDFKSKKWSLCDGVIWSKRTAYKSVPRAESFPTIKAPTDEQADIKATLAKAPQARGGRAVVIDAGPGCGKTTTLSWCLAFIYARIGSLFNYIVCCFNRNARDVLLSKLPLECPEVHTLNSAGGKAQGYTYKQYDDKKVSKLYWATQQGVPEEQKQQMGVVKQVIERMRDCCLYNNSTDQKWWDEAIIATLDRFPGLHRRYKGHEAHVAQYVPMLAHQAHAQSSTIDIQEQITRPVQNAIVATGWLMPFNLVTAKAEEWTDADVAHFAKLIRAIKLPQAKGLVIDEAQDLSLAQIATNLAQVWQSGELTLIGDDKYAEPGEDGYKAGQAIYGWRGAFPGSFLLIERLWHALTGEQVIRKPLNKTHRCGPEIVAALHDLNTVLVSSRPKGSSAVHECSDDQAMAAWLELEAGKTGLWLTRTNAPLAGLLLTTLRNHEECCIRGNGDFAYSVEGTLAQAAGQPNGEEYKTSLSDTLAALQQTISEDESPNPDSMESFLLEVGKSLTAEMLTKAEITDGHLTTGNLRRFVLYFAQKTARRVLSTVYRAKGDEADMVVVSDTEQFNKAWGGNEDEAAACRHVAASRARDLLLIVGHLEGVSAPLLAEAA